MSEIQTLIAQARSAADRSGLSVSTISRKLFNDGKAIARLEAGGQCTIKTLETARARLAELEGAPAKPSAPVVNRAQQEAPVIPPSTMTHLDRLEAESIHIMREVAAEAENPVMLYSVGKDSAVMLHLAMKAFYPSKPPFPVMHVDTTWKFREMIKFRDDTVARLGLDLIVHINEEGVAQGVGPFTHGSQVHTDIMKTQALKQALDKYKFDAAFGATRKNPAPRSGFFPSARASIAGTRRTSARSSGISTIPASPKANRSACFRSPTGRNSISGNISIARTFPSCRCISPPCGPWSSATAR